MSSMRVLGSVRLWPLGYYIYISFKCSEASKDLFPLVRQYERLSNRASGSTNYSYSPPP